MGGGRCTPKLRSWKTSGWSTRILTIMLRSQSMNTIWAWSTWMAQTFTASRRLSCRVPDWGGAGTVYQSSDGIQFDPRTPRVQPARCWPKPDAQAHGLGPRHADQRQPHPLPAPGRQPLGFQRDERGRFRAHGLTQPQTTLVDVLPSNVAPAWSPDGQYIVFLSSRTDSGNAGAWRLWVMDAEGGNPQVLPIDVPIQYTFGSEQVVSGQ